MNAKSFAVGLIFIFLGFSLNQVCIPVPNVGDWEPFPSVHIPVPTVNYVNPLGWLVYPLIFIGAIFLAFGITSSNTIRVILMMLISAAFLYWHGIPIQILRG